MSTEPTDIHVKESASILTVILALVVVALLAVGVFSFVQENKTEDAATAAAHKVGEAAEEVGDAAKDVADRK
jgi:flagellar basal body-associated protein FliL